MSKADQVWSQMPMLRLRAMFADKVKAQEHAEPWWAAIFRLTCQGRSSAQRTTSAMRTIGGSRHSHRFLRNQSSMIPAITAMEPITRG